jgi:hypothetical protein
MVFQNGFIEPMSLFKGILKLSELIFSKSIFLIRTNLILKLMKFVPASGAATRMFKFLRNFLDEYDVLNESINAYINRKTMSLLFLLLEWIKFHFRDN